ncbi:F-box/LRR-repeat protein At3g03360-like [Bidens hawaiensis]|uniref:F-box/LRR-repeat protein At3g03360-like n=1 Tax=Bidens hawaiensis TaxID=980011 RepID=UPI0040491944
MKKQKTKHSSNTKLSSILRKAIRDRKQRKMDRIPELPLHIIHHILYRLHRPKDITRITIHSVQKFKISLSQGSFNLNNWIHAVINENVKELEVHVDLKSHYLLPNTVFTSKNLTSLKLHGCKVHNNIIINLCNLKRLWIRRAHITTNLINNFFQGCPLVEDVRLTHCNGLDYLCISTLNNLCKVLLHECHGLVSVNIELTTLVSFSLCVADALECKLNLAGCENLKSLTIKDPNLTEKLFQDLIINFPCLEKVVLRECNRLERLTILSRTVKKLSVIRCRLLKDPVIDAPYLSTFEYSGCKSMHVSMLQISDLHEAKLHLQTKEDGFVLFGELEWFLQKFKESGGWKMVVSSNKVKNITIYEEVSKIQHDM